MVTENCIPVSTQIVFQAQNSALGSGYAIPLEILFQPKSSSGSLVDFSTAISAQFNFQPLTGPGSGAAKARSLAIVNGSANGIVLSFTEAQIQNIINDCNATNQLYSIQVQLSNTHWLFVAQGLLQIQLLP